MKKRKHTSKVVTLERTELVGMDPVQDLIELTLFSAYIRGERIVSLLLVAEPESGKTEDEKERFIEVKHFRGESGTFELTPYQWKKAEAEKDKYFVYIVSGLKEGDKPTLEIMQNPVKYLMADPPIQKKFSDWKNGIIRVVRCKKV